MKIKVINHSILRCKCLTHRTKHTVPSDATKLLDQFQTLRLGWFIISTHPFTCPVLFLLFRNENYCAAQLFYYPTNTYTHTINWVHGGIVWHGRLHAQLTRGIHQAYPPMTHDTLRKVQRYLAFFTYPQSFCSQKNGWNELEREIKENYKFIDRLSRAWRN